MTNLHFKIYLKIFISLALLFILILNHLLLLPLLNEAYKMESSQKVIISIFLSFYLPIIISKDQISNLLIMNFFML